MKLTKNTTVRALFLRACEDEDLDKVRTILSYGANVNWREQHLGWSGLHWAINNDSARLFELFLSYRGIDVNTADAELETPLMRACQLGLAQMVRSLCEAPGVDLNLRDEQGRTALLHAVLEGQAGCVEVLRARQGVDWNARDEQGDSPLSVAVEQGDATILQIILSVPAPYLELGFTDAKGRNIAQIAVEAGRDIELVKVINGVDSMEEDTTPYLELEFADAKGRNIAQIDVEDVELLEGINGEDGMDLELGSTDDVKDLEGDAGDGGLEGGVGLQPAEIQEVKQEQEVMEGPNEDRSKDDDEDKDGYEEGDPGIEFLECFKLLAADARVDLNIKNGAGDSPLMFCLKNKKVEMAKVLLLNPWVDLDTMDSSGNYPENIARYFLIFS